MLIIEGERIILRDHLKTDLEDMHEWRSDNEVMRFAPNMKTTSLAETKIQLVDDITESLRTQRVKYFLAVVLKSGEIIGDAGFTVLCRNDNGGIANMGYFLKRQFWGQGYGTEAARLLIKYCFENLGFHKVTAGCDGENKSSEKIMLKCGMKKEAEFQKHVLVDCVWRDRLEYAILRPWTRT
ncbi:MAG TPA: GNAT family protein [Bacillota bacterium]|nr:GNAT family protein [Bacillota bacterium]